MTLGRNKDHLPAGQHKPKPQKIYLQKIFIYILLVMLAWSPLGFAAEVPDVSNGDGEAWLVTYGPGQVYWERFGHNAIWLREPAEGIDHTFNFGFFDFEQEDFFLRFLQGRMLYFSVAQVSEREFEFYRQQNRNIRVQKLALDTSQYRRLRDYLLQEIRPENRDYRYDYYLNNCSTRIRDALDLALDGTLSNATENTPAKLNLRGQTRRLTEMQYWFYLALELGLGSPIDRDISRWDEMFVPMVVADELAELSVPGSVSTRPLVREDMMLHVSSLPMPAAQPSTTWQRYLLLGLLVVGLAWLSGRFMPAVWLGGLCNAWLLIAGTNGLVLAYLWWFTDHSVASANANLLLFNPLVVFALVPALNRLGAVVLAGGVVLSLVLLLFPQHQYNLDIIALLAPVNLAVAAWFFKRPVK